MIDKKFVTAGKAIFTIEPSAEFIQNHGCNPHYTYKVNFKEGSMKFPPTYFISLLTGQNNETDYQYMGLLDPQTGLIRLTAKSKHNTSSFPVLFASRVLGAIWKDLDVEKFGWKVHHEGKCCRCGRTLTTPESCTRGIGPECFEKMVG